MDDHSELFTALFAITYCTVSLLSPVIPVCGCDCKWGHGASQFKTCYSESADGELIGCRCVYTDADKYPYNAMPTSQLGNPGATRNKSMPSIIKRVAYIARMTHETGEISKSSKVARSEMILTCCL